MMLHQVSLINGVISLVALAQCDNVVRKRTFIGDPRRNITCLGSSYDMRLPIRPDGFDLNQLTMQQLCAKPIYGGVDIAVMVGGWCSKGLEPAYERDGDDEDDDVEWSQDDEMFPTLTGVSFDHTVTPWINPPGWLPSQRYYNDRLYAGCLNRCFCSWEVDDLTLQPKREVPSNADVITKKTDESKFVEIKLELVEMDGQGHQPAFFNRVNDGTDISVLQVIPDLGEPNEEGGYAETHSIEEQEVVDLSLDPGNEITCEGDLPSFTLPPPYTNADFRNPQELCAVQWSGGLSGANAGGYCHRGNPRMTPGSSYFDNQVWFSDEMTPRYEYTWGGGNFFLAASLRTYCYAHCYCTSVGKARTKVKTYTMWQFLRNHQLIAHGDGSMDYGKRGPMDTGVYRRIAQVLPPRAGAAPYASGTCGSDGKQFCPAPWPEAQLGPIPRAPPFSNEIELPPSPDAGQKRNLTICGNKCSGQSDCSPTEDGYVCDCALPNEEDARVLGLDPVAPPSICLSLDFKAFGYVSGLHGRDEVVDEGSVPYQCRCNVTYTGSECCGSRDGMVWLE